MRRDSTVTVVIPIPCPYYFKTVNIWKYRPGGPMASVDGGPTKGTEKFQPRMDTDKHGWGELAAKTRRKIKDGYPQITQINADVGIFKSVKIGAIGGLPLKKQEELDSPLEFTPYLIRGGNDTTMPIEFQKVALPNFLAAVRGPNI